MSFVIYLIDEERLKYKPIMQRQGLVMRLGWIEFIIISFLEL